MRDRVPGQTPSSTASSNHKRNFSSSNQSSSGHSSVVTSPDFLDQGNTPHYNEIPNVLQPVATFLEHAQINKANCFSQPVDASSVRVLGSDSTKNLSERLKRVVNTLLKLRETVNDKALRHLKDTFESSLKGLHFIMIHLNNRGKRFSKRVYKATLLSCRDSPIKFYSRFADLNF